MEIPLSRRAPRIKINREACTVPFLCKKCILTCPQSVFEVRPIKVERLKETDPREDGSYQVGAGWRFKCTGCNDCVKVCPVDAITITWPG